MKREQYRSSRLLRFARSCYRLVCLCHTGRHRQVSKSLAAFARALMANPDHAGVGMLVLVNRIAEAADMATALQDYRDRLCIYTSHDPTNALGAHDTANDAQVCIATQAALKATLKGLQGAPFAAATRFQFRGARRAVICWDEAFALQQARRPWRPTRLVDWHEQCAVR